MQQALNIHDLIKSHVLSKKYLNARGKDQGFISNIIYTRFKEVSFGKRLFFIINNIAYIHHIQELLGRVTEAVQRFPKWSEKAYKQPKVGWSMIFRRSFIFNQE